jgi:hypothetical protein
MATIGSTPTWTAQPTAGLYINSVGISANAQRVIAGNYLFAYTATANHRSQPTYPVGTYAWDAGGALVWKDEFTAVEGVYWVALSRDGAWAASGGLLAEKSGFLYAYNAATGAKGLTFATNARVNMVALSQDGTHLVAGAADLYVSKRTGAKWSKPKAMSVAKGDSIVAVGISDDGAWICAGTVQGRIVLLKNSGTLKPVVTAIANQSVHWIVMAANGTGFVAAMSSGEIAYFATAGFKKNIAPTWTATLPGCSRCGAVAISANGGIVSAVGNVGNAGKVCVFTNTGAAGQLLWSQNTAHNPNSTSLDDTAQFVTVADGYPDGTSGAFYLYSGAGSLKWTFPTPNMSWPMQLSADGSAIFAGSDDASVYYFS